MAITGKFLADFESFYAAVQKAEVQLRGMETGAGKVSTSLNRMVDSFSGRKLIQDATLSAEAVERIGGVSKLTSAELQRVSTQASEAAQKLRAMGEDVPPKIAKLAAEAKTAGGALETMKGIAGSLAGAFGIAFSVGAVVNWVGGVIDAASHIDDLSKKLGASREAVQRWQFAAEQSGATIDDVATSIAFMNKNLAVGDSSTIGALRLAGLRFEDIRKMKPEDAFNAITEAVGKIEDPMTRARVAVELFGRGGQTLLPAITEGFVKVGEQAEVMSEETVKRLDAAGDAWAKLGNTVKIYSGELIAATIKAFSQPPNENAYLQKWLDALHINAEAAKSDLSSLGQWLDVLRGKMETLPKVAAPKIPTMEPLTVPQMSDEDMQKILDDLVKEKERLTGSTKAADQHAEAIRRLVDAYTGADKIRAAKDSLEAVNGALRAGIPISKMTRDQQDAINKMMADATAIYRAHGQEAPADIRAVFLATMDIEKAIPVVVGLGREFEHLGQQVPIAPMLGLNTTIKGFVDTFSKYSTVLKVEAIPSTDTWESHLGDLSGALSQLAQISGDTFGGIVRDLATVVSAAETARKSIASIQSGLKTGGAAGLLETTSGLLALAAAAMQVGKALQPLLGLHHGKLGELLGTNASGREIINNFAAAHGGYEQLHSDLLKIIGGERIWIQLTQEVGRANATQANAAVEAANSFLSSHRSIEEEIAAAGFHTNAELQATADTAKRVYEAMKTSGMFSAAQVQEAWEQSQAAQRAAMGQTGAAYEKAVAAIKGMDDQIKSLSDSIAGEAPEEFMGIVERNAREQIAAIQKQRDEAQLALDQTAGDAAQAAEDAAQAIEDTLDRHDFRVNIKVNVEYPPGYDPHHPELWMQPAPSFTSLPVPGAPTPEYPGFASGTKGQYLDFGSGTPVTLHGRERVMTESESSSGGGISQPIIIQTFLDGRMVAESTVPYIPDVVKRYGLA